MFSNKRKDSKTTSYFENLVFHFGVWCYFTVFFMLILVKPDADPMLDLARVSLILLLLFSYIYISLDTVQLLTDLNEEEMYPTHETLHIHEIAFIIIFKIWMTKLEEKKIIVQFPILVVKASTTIGKYCAANIREIFAAKIK